MVRPQERRLDYDCAGVYEFRSPDLLDGQVHLQTFAKPHVINGHRLLCVLTKSRARRFTLSLDTDTPGVTESASVLLLDSREASGMSVHESLKIDGQIYTITGLSQPVSNVTRLELLGHAG